MSMLVNRQMTDAIRVAYLDFARILFVVSDEIHPAYTKETYQQLKLQEREDILTHGLKALTRFSETSFSPILKADISGVYSVS